MPDTPDTPDTPPGSATEIQHAPPVHLMSDPPAGTDRYELLEEIARGGMGVVWRARDRVLGREVGIKTLLKIPAAGGTMAARFREEARITGRLQHPNIPPVHDLGTLADGRPFLAMKLIDGRTLDALLKERPDPAHDRGRFVAAFEQIAHGVAYAHSRGVVHRDLKPLNVMVGAFGEVQVMDWGLAKVLADAEPAQETADARPAGGATRAGSVLGTPAYMPPEQALGAIDRIDARSDVFSLGGVLCAILTGAPPYRAADGASTQQLAAAAKLDDALARLTACGAEPDLVALCARCLSAERDDRPRDAGEVARAVADFRAEAESRARQAELDRVRATEGRKRAHVQLLLAGAVLLLLAAGGGFAWWQQKQATERKLADADAKANEARLAGERDAEARNKAKQARDGINTNLELSVQLRQEYKFNQAEAALTQAAELARGGAPERLAEVEHARRDLAFVRQLDDIRYRKWTSGTKPGGGGEFNTKIASPEYRKVFANHGLDLPTLPPAEAAQRIATSKVRADLVAAVDDWALYEVHDGALCDRLLEIARRADPGAWTDRLRDATAWTDTDAVKRLAAEARLDTLTPSTVSVLAALMKRRGLDPSSLLTAARVRHPSSFELAVALGLCYAGTDTGGQQIGPYEAARALRPENQPVWNNLGNALRSRGDLAGAVAAYNKAIELNPNDALAHNNLGAALADRGKLAAAVAALNKAIELDPRYAQAHFNLGVALFDKGDHGGAVAAYNRAIDLDPKDAVIRYNLGVALLTDGDLTGAVAASTKAIELDPTFAPAHHNLAVALTRKGDLAGAVAAYNKTIELDPKNAQAYDNLGGTLCDMRNWGGAAAAYKRAVELDPRFARAHANLGAVHHQQKQFVEAVACARTAIKADPKYSQAHAVLGLSLQATGDAVGARAALTEAARLDPGWGGLLAKLPPPPLAPRPREATRP